MFRHWLTAVVIALLAWSGADAQSGKAQVDVRSGGVVVKKVIKNGEVVDEDVQVFGDLDEQLRDQILALVKRWRADGDKKATGATKRGRKPEKPDRKRGAPEEDDEGALVFRLGRPRIELRGDWDEFPGGEHIRKEIEKALERFGGEDGQGLRLLLPPDAPKHLDLFRGGRLPGGWLRLFGPDHDDGDSRVEAKAHVRVDINGKTVLDKELECSPESGQVRVFRFDEAGKKGAQAKKKSAARKAPARARLKKETEKTEPGQSPHEAIERLEKSLDRLQRQIDRLKKELDSIRPVKVRGAAMRTA